MTPVAASRSVAGELPWAFATCAAAVLSAGVAAGASSDLATGILVAALLAVLVGSRRATTGQASIRSLEVSDAAGTVVRRDDKQLWVPLWVSLGWLIGTFAAFWITGLAGLVTNAPALTAFVAFATGAFAWGYALRIRRCPAVFTVTGMRGESVGRGRSLILLGAAYLAVFGLLQLGEYGATGVGSIVASLKDPGSAYQAKFSVYALQRATSRVSVPMQIITLAGALYGVLAPLLIIFWRRVSPAVRCAGVLGLLIYCAYFLFIGTQKGLGDTVILLTVGAFAGTFGTWWERRPARGREPKPLRYAAAAVAVFLVYMVSAQSQRAETFGTQKLTPPNPAVASIIGDKAATGVAATLFYPTHGYLGLSYNLGMPFEWTRGLGSSPVIASYAVQYLDAAIPQTYPLRTEFRTGWPAGHRWATIYPWLASDFTFPGVVAVMMVFGWLFAHMWVEGAVKRDILALVIFGQLAITVAYVPANNQLGCSRPTTIGLITLAAVYCARAVLRTAGARPPAHGDSGEPR